MRRLYLLAAVTVMGSLATSSCAVGDIGDAADAPVVPSTTADAAAKPPRAPMRRLTQTEYKSAIHAVFGASIEPSTPLDQDDTAELFSTMGASLIATSNHGVELYEAAALDLAQQIVDHRGDYPELATCAPASANDPCIAAAIRAFGRSLWRRPLSDAEVSRLAKVAGAAGEDAQALSLGLRYALAGLLASPSFLYVPVTGEADPSGGTRLTANEIATRLALFLWDSIPDEGLLAAAANGSLSTAEGLEAQTTRMLADARAADLVTRFFSEHWDVARMSIADKNTDIYPEWNESLYADMLREFDVVLRTAVKHDTDLLDVFNQRKTYATPELASFYGVAAPPSSFGEVTLEAHRAGLMTSAAVISASSPSNRTSPVRRGVFVLERVLCGDVPSPPPNVNTGAIDQESGDTTKTMRQKMEEHVKNPVCASCHDTLDNVGFPFESFDAIGRYRTKDNGQPVDPSGSLDGHAFSGARDLADFVRGDPRTPRCIARRLYTFATGHEPKISEQPYLDDMTLAFEGSHHSFRSLVLAIVRSDAFRTFTPEVTP